MRRQILLIAMAMAAFPAGALAKRETVAQLEQALNSAVAAHKPATELARLIVGAELSDRLSEATAERLNAQLNAGSETSQALALQVDESAFLDLPSNELPAATAPDEATQRKIFNAAGAYVEQTLARLPDFIATRTTVNYDDSPQELKKGAWPVRAGLHFVGRSTQEISVFGERANLSAGSKSSNAGEPRGMISWGEFGSVLGMILGDSEHGTVTWSHWEEGSPGRSAVFHYSVPKAASHFQVVGAYQRQASMEGFTSRLRGDRASSMNARPNDSPGQVSVTRGNRAYEGDLWVDPVTGTVLRVTIQVNAKDNAAFQLSEMLVDYGPVEVGGSNFICPVRSVAFSKSVLSAEASTGNAASEWLNETRFSAYRRFVGTTRIVVGADAATPNSETSADRNGKPH
jgi:hypothetical protein